MRRFWLAALALLAMGLSAAAQARPYTVDDMLRQEAFGNAMTDPSGRWLVFERTDRYDTAARYENDVVQSLTLGRLQVVDLTHPGPARPLLRPDPGPGQVIGVFSPSGARFAVYRDTGRTWTLGVVEMATGAVRWFPDTTPEKSILGRGVQWLSDTELLVIDRPDGLPTWTLREGHASAQRLPGQWEASATGKGAHTVFGSGAYANLREQPTPRRLLRLDVVTGQRRTLATGQFTDLELSPDRARVALLADGDPVQSRTGEPVQGDRGIETLTNRLSILDLKTGGLSDPCGRCDALPHLLAWSPSGRALLVFERTPGTAWTAGGLYAVDAASGRSRRVGEGLSPRFQIRPAILHAGWMGEAPVVLARPTGIAEARDDWYRLGDGAPVNLTRQLPAGAWTVVAAGPDGLNLLAGDALWRTDRAGQGTPIAGPPAALVRTSQLITEGRLYNILPDGAWIASGAGAARQARWTTSESVGPPIALPHDDRSVVAFSALTGAAVVSERDEHGAQALDLLRPGAPPLALAQINTDLEAVDITRTVRIAHKGPDGQPLSSWLLLPPRAPGSPPPPLVIRPYSGLAYARPPTDPANAFVGNYRALVGHGYAVLVPSLPLPKDRLDPMPGLADRILAIVDAAAADPATAGLFDPLRLALLGHSYGGYTVQAAIGQSDRFRAAVSISGLSDLFSKWETLASVYRAVPQEGPMYNWSMGSVEAGQDEMFRPPWADPARYARNSPMYAVDHIHTPLLLFHGDQDIIMVEQSDAMFAALYREGKDAISVTYWGEGHAIGSPGNVRDMFQRTFSFLDQHFRDPPAGSAGPRPNPEPGPASGGPKPRPPPP